jgi:FG-GAP-like repeat
MADITLGQTITGSLTSDDLKYDNSITVYDRYNFVGLDGARQVTINVNRNLFDSFNIALRNADTDEIVTYTTNAFGSGGSSISATTLPGVNYVVEVDAFSGTFNFVTGTYYDIKNKFGPYTLSTVDGGKPTSIVTTNKVQQNLDNVGIPVVGTVGADGKFFPLASSYLTTLTDVALAPNGQFYGIGGGTILFRIDLSKRVSDQIQYANGVGSLSIIKDTRGFSLGGSFDAIEFANNKLYGLFRTNNGDKLYTIDTTTPAPSITAGYTATLVGDLPAGLLNKGGDLVYDAANRRFLVTAEGLPNNDALWQIPIDNPAGATSIGLTGFADVTGINFENGRLTGFTGGTSPTRISIDAATGAGTVDRAISGVTNLSGAATIPVSRTRNDFNGDYKSDVLWRNDNGDVALWQMNGSTLTTGSVFANISTAWKIASAGDFNDDGKADILWRNADGQVAIWQMNGATPTTQTVIGSVPTNWQISGTGNFNGDGKADILWRNTADGSVAIWQMNGNTPTAQTVVGAASTDWKISGTGDFNGDGKSDLLWRNDNGSVAMWQMNGTTPISQTVFASVSTDWQIAGTGDFNGDGKADILWRNNDGQVAIWQMNGTTALSKDLATPYPSVDNSWKISGTSDFNGDGKADILWRNDNGSVETWLMNGSTVTAANLVSPNPVVDNSWKIAAPIL